MHNQFYSILDAEISSKEDDKFGHVHLAELLAQLIKQHTPPYSIGLLGKWGVGKSSIKKICQKDFLDKKDFKIIDFNAWRYESSDIRESLLKHIYIKLTDEDRVKNKEEEFLEKLFQQATDKIQQLVNPKQYCINFLAGWGINLIQITLIFVITSIFVGFLLFVEKYWLLYSNDYLRNSCGILYLIIGGVVMSLLKEPLGSGDFAIPRYIEKTITKFPLKHSLEYEKLVNDQVKIFLKKTENNNKKIIVFIDDLDRLSPDEMVKGIDAIRVFLDMPDNKMIFVISCDEKNIAKALAEKKEISEARRYLDRVFKFRLEVPPFPNDDLIGFAKSHIKDITNDSSFEDELKSANCSLDNLLDKLIHVNVQDPRNTIQLINAYFQSWWVVKQREQKCRKECSRLKGNACVHNLEKECLLNFNIITNDPQTLAIITVLKIDFPDFYYDLTKEPDLLKYILYLMFNIRLYSFSLNDTLKRLAENHLTSGNPDKTIEQTTIYKFKDSKLQSYLSSIQYVNLPDSLQSFILLLEDSITRELGSDLAKPLYNVLITNNKDEFQKILNIDLSNNDNVVNENITKLLYEIRQQIQRKEVPDRQSNADILIGKALNLFTGNYSVYFYTFLASRLINELKNDDFKVTANIGYHVIKDILLSDNLSSHIINSLYEELLKDIENKKFYFNVKEYNKQWLYNMIEIGLDLLYEKNILNANLKNKLMSILQLRSYRYPKIGSTSPTTADYEERHLEFDIIEKSIDRYKEKILLDIDSHYIDEYLGELHQGSILFKPEKHIPNIAYIFDHYIAKQNDKATNIVIEHLGKCISNINEQIVNFAMGYIKEKNMSENLNIEQYDYIISCLSERLLNSIESEDWYLTNMIEYSQRLLDAYRLKSSELSTIKNSNTSNKIKNLILEYSKQEEVIEFSKQLFKIYFESNKEISKDILLTWCNNLFKDEKNSYENIIDIEIVNFIASEYVEDFESSEYPHITSIVNQLKNSPEIIVAVYPQNDFTRYSYFIENLSDKARKNGIIARHLDTMYKNLYSAERSSFEYFYQIFPVIVKIMNNHISSNLNNLLTIIINDYLLKYNVKTSLLYLLLTDHWPEKNQDFLPIYEPQAIFESASNLIKDCKESGFDSIIVFKSIQSMLECKIILDTNSNKEILVKSALRLWNKNIPLISVVLIKYVDVALNEYVYVLKDKTPNDKQEYLKNVWEKIIETSRKTNESSIVKETQRIILNYSSIDKLWFKLLYTEYNDLNVLNKAILELLESKEDKAKILDQNRRTIINKFLEKEYGIAIKSSLAKTLFTAYCNENDGAKYNQIARWIKELMDSDASDIINKDSIRERKLDQDSKYASRVNSLSSFFSENDYLLRLNKRLVLQKAKSKKNKPKK